MATKAAELYDEDFYAWTQQQAEVIRSLRGDNRLDVDHLAEEIEDLGKSELHTVESLIEQVIAHLLKLDYSAQDLPRNHWRHEVVAFRDSAERRMTPTIRRKAERGLKRLYERARHAAARGTQLHEPDFLRRLPRACPYDWNAIWNRDVLAEGGIDFRD